MRLFTLDEARTLLPEVRAICEAMQAAKRRLDAQRGASVRPERRTGTNGQRTNGVAHGAGDAGERAAREVQAAIDRLAALGVEVKGIDAGLVDFPSERDGRTVYLCWQLGEPDIAHWHELDTGFAGRRPL